MIKIILALFFCFYFSYADETYHSIKGGILSHSTGPISSGRENGIDLHGELQFKEKILKGHFAVGADINTNGDTSFIFGGLAWEDRFFDNLLLGAFFGFATHDGELNNGNSDKRQLGTRLLFREAIDIGFYIKEDISISLIYDHYSNVGLNDMRNQGNDNLGIRLGYYF
ncbi:MAG: acyloxyacyl hydrolase [Arcobacteraceae bacterium]|nr:acyloxyacyl hydrolase [Arcobacteraceae bacterium]